MVIGIGERLLALGREAGVIAVLTASLRLEKQKGRHVRGLMNATDESSVQTGGYTLHCKASKSRRTQNDICWLTVGRRSYIAIQEAQLTQRNSASSDTVQRKLFEVVDVDANRKLTYDFLLVINNNCDPISQTWWRNGWKSPKCPTPLTFNALTKGTQRNSVWHLPVRKYRLLHCQWIRAGKNLVF